MKRLFLILLLFACTAVASDYTGPTTPANEDNSDTLLKKIAKSLSGTSTASGTATTTATKQYTGTPSTATIGTSDGTVFTLAAGEIGFIQNLDDAALAVKKGASASTTSLSFILAAGTAADDGKGGAVEIKDWVGAVSVAAMSGSPRYIAWKQAP